MRKIWTSILCFGLVMGLSAPIYAGTTVSNSSGGAGTLLTVTDADANLEFTPSPNVEMGTYTEQDAFAIGSHNARTNEKNGMVYLVLSSTNGFFQKKKPASFTFAAPTDATTTTGYVAMGGTSDGGS